MSSVRIGNALLINGDAFDVIENDVNLRVQIDSIVTDPPYGMSFQSNSRKVKYDKIENDETPEAALAIINWGATHVRHSMYVFGRWDNVLSYPKPKSLITWIKNMGGMGDLEHEHKRKTECVFFYPGPQHFFPNGRPEDIVFAGCTGNKLHPTEKPVELLQQILKWTNGVVFDPFMGSGTTGVACARLGIPFIGIEISDEYFATACRRIEEEESQRKLF